MIEFTLADIVLNLIKASVWTIVLSLVSFVGGSIVGLLILLMRTSRLQVLRNLSAGFIKLFQGTPLLMQLFLAFFGIALMGVSVPAWMAAGLALILWTAAFLAEIWRGCVEALPRGQWEASSSLAMSFTQQMRYVVLPQALRIAIPPTVGFCIQIVKGTSLTSIIGFVEVAKAASNLANATLAPLPVYATTAIIYFALCFPISKFSRKLERDFNVAHQH